MSQPIDSLDFTTLQRAYRTGALRPTALVELLLERIEATRAHNVWIHLLAPEALRARARELEGLDPETLPLYGLPFAIKDNIDLAGVPTTVACPDYAYTPGETAFVVQRLLAAGALPLGKTNLDQFATGLVGTRSPYGPCRNAFDPDYISGGSSAGSAVAVALGLASFALGTDTAGSGRVPAAFNNLIGLKPTHGLLSTRGVVPACRTLDCVSVFALTAADAARVLDVAQAPDPGDIYARSWPADAAATRFGAWPGGPLSIGLPREADLDVLGEAERGLFEQARAHLETLGARFQSVDLRPFTEAAALLYQGHWVTERYMVAAGLLTERPEALHPVTRAILEPAGQCSAQRAFESIYALQTLKRRCDPVMQELDALLLPTAPTIHRIEEIERDPIALNSRLGTWTNFMNLLDYMGVAVPAGFLPNGLPFGVTLCARPFSDRVLLSLAQTLQGLSGLRLGAGGAALPKAGLPVMHSDRAAVVLCGAHMRGLPLSPQVEALGGRFLHAGRTAPHYRLHALTAFDPPRPGLVRATPPEQGGAIEVEVWDLPRSALGEFLLGIPAPLGLGRVELDDGQWLTGFLCEAAATRGAEDITALQGWRAWLAAR